jgi:hypothetical protein
MSVYCATAFNILPLPFNNKEHDKDKFTGRHC